MNKIELKNMAVRIAHLGMEDFQHLGAVIKGMDRGRRAVLAACTLTFAFFLLRLGFIDGWRGAVIGVALLVLDVGITLTLHVEAKPYWERDEAWRGRCDGREQKKQALAAAESELQGNQNAREKLAADIQEIENELKLRERLNFDIKQISTAAAAAAREGYLSGIDSNKGRYAA